MEPEDSLTPADAARIREEYRERQKDPDLLHNLTMHAYLLKTWQRDSPKMWASLTAQGVTEEFAFLAQQKMWEERDRLKAGGMMPTDAREEAERQHLLLAPEDDGEDEDEEE